MKTAIEILDMEGFDFAAFEFENEYSAKSILSAIKVIAELSFDAGYERACEEELSSNLTAPNKEQFIKELFKEKEYKME